MRILVLFAVSVASAIPTAACIIGNLDQAPIITILTAPPDCCYGSWAGDITGVVSNVDSDSTGVVLYAQTNVYWVQPYAASPWTDIACPDGAFSNSTHGGHHYCAILAKKTWDPPATMGYLPPIGGDILAIDCVPSPPRMISAFGYEWFVKGNTIPMDPGPNLFSDSEENVWVDAQGKVHLRITLRGDQWYCAEIFSEGFFAPGLYVFEIGGQIDVLDPNLVLGCFLYSENFPVDNDEIDFEASRWGSNGPDAQYVLQPWDVPGNRHQFAMILIDPTSVHTICWEDESVTFSSCQGVLGHAGELIEQWTYVGQDIPVPDAERMRFNLWLFNGSAPMDGQEVEIVISNFLYRSQCQLCTEITDVPVASKSWSSVKKMYR